MMDAQLLESHDHRRLDQVRNAVAILLDGKLPPDDGLTLAAWRLADTLGDLPSLQAVLELWPIPPSILPSRCDRFHLVLDALSPAVAPWEGDIELGGPRFLPCPGLLTRLSSGWITDFLDAGGVLVTSDRAIEHEPIRSIIPAASRSAPRRVRIAPPPTLQPFSIAPAVQLPPGHAPLDRDACERRGHHVVAADLTTGEPLVVLAQTGRGQVLHAVPHWLQQECGWFTDLERLPMSGLPRSAEWTGAEAGLTLGDFGAALAMSDALRRGLLLASGAVESLDAGKRSVDERVAGDD